MRAVGRNYHIVEASLNALGNYIGSECSTCKIRGIATHLGFKLSKFIGEKWSCPNIEEQKFRSENLERRACLYFSCTLLASSLLFPLLEHTQKHKGGDFSTFKNNSFSFNITGGNNRYVD
jgi:hypothetical protein